MKTTFLKVVTSIRVHCYPGATLKIQFNDWILTGILFFVLFFFYKDTQDVGGGRRQGPLMVSAQ